MKKIGVISDTHITNKGMNLRSAWNRFLTRGDQPLPEVLAREFEGVDLIIHCGDLVELWVLDLLKEIAPVEAVAGNMDGPEARQELPIKKNLEIEGIKLGIIHGGGSPHGMIDRIISEFSGVDAILFGHTHAPFAETRDGIFFFNPGSPTDRRFAPYNSLGILIIDSNDPKQKIKSNIIKLD
ncbi:MAG: metallophosphoesterase family protein [Proteobacteria bacterium]|nr:metallophosphoesterase family protein [Pseudomonadota bacterium]